MVHVSVIVPAHNEERWLARTLESIETAFAGQGGSHEVLVVDDTSTDRTPEIALRFGARLVSVQHRQIAATRNAGAREAQGEVLLFVDADTALRAPVVRAALEALAAGAVGGGCRVEFDGPLSGYARFLARVGYRAQRVLRFAAGCFVFCTRAAFEATGGFDEAMYAAEEYEFSKALRKQGRFVVLHESVLTSGRKLRTYSGSELTKTLLRLGLAGKRGVRRREALPVWYEPRREDPIEVPRADPVDQGPSR